MGQWTRPVGHHCSFGCSLPMLQGAVQGFYIAGAFSRQLIRHGALRVGEEGGGTLADLLSFTLQVLIQHVAAEGR